MWSLKNNFRTKQKDEYLEESDQCNIFLSKIQMIYKRFSILIKECDSIKQ